MSFSKGFSTAGHYEHVTFYHANSTHELSLHDLLQYVLARYPGVPLTEFTFGVYGQRDPLAKGCVVTGRDEMSFIGLERMVKEGAS